MFRTLDRALYQVTMTEIPYITIYIGIILITSIDGIDNRPISITVAAQKIVQYPLMVSIDLVLNSVLNLLQLLYIVNRSLLPFVYTIEVDF